MLFEEENILVQYYVNMCVGHEQKTSDKSTKYSKC